MTLGDGSCLFTSVAHSLIQRVQSGDSAVHQILSRLGVSESHFDNITYIRRVLRERMVQEWNNNLEYYQGFLTVDVDLSAVSQEYLDDAHFSGSAGDLMALSIANVIQMPLTIFSPAQNMPLICIMPTTSSNLTPALCSTNPICLAYTPDTGERPGHYDSVIALSDSSLSQVKRTKVARCSCGRKPNAISVPCSSLRCPCFRDTKACCKSCTCKNCGNTHGLRPPVSTTRQRDRYDEQLYPLRRKPGCDFMRDIGEQIINGRFTTLEVLLLKDIVMYCIFHGIEKKYLISSKINCLNKALERYVYTIMWRYSHLVQYAASVYVFSMSKCNYITTAVLYY